MSWLLLSLLLRSAEAQPVLPTPLDVRPDLGLAPPFHAQVPDVLALSNGVSVWFLPRPGLPLVSVRVLVRGGAASDPADMAGLASLTDTLLTRGAGERDAVAFATTTEQLALTLTTSTESGWTTVSLDAHAGRLDAALDLLADALLRPRFDAAELERVRTLRLGQIAQDLDDPVTVARQVATRELFGPSHPYAHPATGTRSGVTAATRDAVLQSYQARFQAGRMAIFASGDVAADALRQALESRLGALARGGEATTTLPPVPDHTRGPRLILVDNPGATQTVLYLLTQGPLGTDPHLHASRMATIALGGTFTSRLNRKLREEKGYTYGVSARLTPDAVASLLSIRTAVQREVTGAALSDLMAELDALREGISADELDKARAARVTQLVSALETRSGVADAYLSLFQTGRGPEGFQVELAALAELNEREVRRAAKHLGFDQGVIVVHGDLASVRAEVEQVVSGAWQVVTPDR